MSDKRHQNVTLRNGTQVTQVVNDKKMKSKVLQDWATRMRQEGKSSRTVQDRMIVLKRFERDIQRPALAANTDEVAEWLARPELATVTKSVYFSILNAFYRHAVVAGLRDDNPMRTLKAARRPKRYPRPPSPGQFMRLLNNAPDADMKAMVLLGGLQGFRVHEIARFHSRQIDIEAQTIEITGKGGSHYILPAHPLVVEHAKCMKWGYWFPSQRAKHIGGRTVSERLRIYMLQQNVNATAHALRHFFGTALVASGADLRVAQELLRHASLQTTAIYVQTSDKRKRDAIDRIIDDLA